MTFKKWLIILMGLVLVADIAIWLDVPVLRQVLGFLCFTIIPGLLIVYTLKLHEIGFVKKFLLSVGLSISLLVFFSLLINAVLPWLGYPTPLSTQSLVISFTIGIAILCFVAYWRNRKDAPITFMPEVRHDIKNKSLWLLLLPVVFPLMSVIGRHFADTNGNNMLLLVMLLLIPLYVIALVWQHKKAPTATYPVALGMIAIALLLSYGLISNYLMGGDIYSEYESFQAVLQNQQWGLAAPRTVASASLSISLLPATLQPLLGIDPLYIYKVVFLLLFSLIPVTGYVIYHRYLGPLYGFLASFLLMAQIPFIYVLPNQMRVGMALVSMSLAFMVLFDDKMLNFNRNILFLLFIISLVVEYYALAVIILPLTFVLWFAPKISKGAFGPPVISFVQGVILPLVLPIFWWGMVTQTAFSEYVRFIDELMANLGGIFSGGLRSSVVGVLFTQSSEWTVAAQITALIQRATFAFIGIGVIAALIWRRQRVKFGGYAVLMATCLVLLVVEIVLPWLSVGYAADRLFIQLLVLLAPAFIIGCQAPFHVIGSIRDYLARHNFIGGSRPRYMPSSSNLVIILVVLVTVSQFIGSTGIPSYLAHSSDSLLLEVNGITSDPRYISQAEVTAAEWLGEHNRENNSVWMDNVLQAGTGEVFEYTSYSASRQFEVTWFRKEEIPSDGTYLFLGHMGVVNGEVNSVSFEGGFPTWERGQLSEYAQLFTDKSRIYANGTAEIFR